MKKINKEKLEVIKGYFLKLKEAWSDPRKKAGIKLLCYFLLFLTIFILAGISNRMNKNENKNSNERTTTSISTNFSTIEKEFLSSNHTINYVIKIDDKTYNLNGVLKENIIEGYLESDSIIKISLKDGFLYESKNNKEEILETDINPKLINPKIILELLNEERAIINDTKDSKEYSYNIKIDNNNYNIIIFIKENKIIEIKINGVSNQYILDFDK